MGAVDASPVFLIGFMASGKSTVGRRLAERLGRRFVDLDEAVEQRVGLAVPEIFRQQGEAAFRAHEAATLRELLAARDVVVACGGGTPVHGDNLARMRAAGLVIALAASLETVLARALVPGAPDRPLLAGPAAQAEALYQARAAVYATADVVVSTDARSVDAVVDEAVRELRSQLGQVSVRLGERSYPIHFAPLSEAGKLLRARGLRPGARVLVVTDENVMTAGHADTVCAALTAGGFAAAVIAIPAGEAFKTATQAECLASTCIQAGLDRQGAIVAVGGGVIGDLAGFVAATVLRGVPWAVVPTTLLAMVDSSIGGKTGVDLPEGKNLLGAFWQPRFVLADTTTLTTLPARELTAAAGEVLKYALLEGAPELEAIDLSPAALPELIARCAAAKARVVALDERETTGARATLNLGHTVGHALEAASWTTGAPLLHGEAVALGLIACGQISEALGVAAPGLAARIAAACARLGLPSDLAAYTGPAQLAALLPWLAADKKRAGRKLGFIVIEAPGRVRTHELAADDVIAILRGDSRR